jgi:acetate CoA/acetoacetate CoA-transferase beta subunit
MDKNEIKAYIAKRVAKELHDGDVVNLGIGIPTLVTKYLPEGVHLVIHAEDGIVGAGGAPTEENIDALHVVDAAGSPATVAPYGCFADSALNFGLIRGGHVDATILGGLEVDAEGSLSNWIIPGKKMPGMGGAMDLLVGAKKVIVAMEHTAKGNPKILEKCTLPYTAVHCVDLIITEMGVMEVTKEGIVLKEINPEFTVEEVQAATGAKLIISPDLKNVEA